MSCSKLDAIGLQLAILQQERITYSSRVSSLANHPERSAELQGYLRLIDNINAACLNLARQAGADTARQQLLGLAA